MTQNTFKCQFHLEVSTLLNTALRQVNIAPTLSNFQAAVNICKDFEAYRVTKVSYVFNPLVTVSLQNQIPLASYYVVRDINGSFPAATVVEYLKYGKVRMGTYNG